MALAALLVPAAGSAGAAELLVMPYACTMADGQPVLTPGPERGYRIVGERGRQRFTACSPVNPDMCRTWTLHRFDLDCDGERASWVSVMAATDEGSRRAWLLGGRFLLRMGPRWSLAPDDPCAYAHDADNEGFAFDRRMQLECEDRLASAPPAVVEMPFGYAPMLGIDAIFVEAHQRSPGEAPPPTSPPVAAGPAPAESASTGERPAAPVRPAPETPEPARRTAAATKAEAPDVAATAKPGRAGAPPPSRTQRTEQPPQPPAADAKAKPKPKPKPKAKATASKAPAKVAAAKRPPAPGGAATPAVPPPVPKEAQRAPRREPAPAGSGTSAAPPAAPEAAPPPPPKRAERPAAPSGPATPAQPEPAPSLDLLSVFRATTTGAIVAFAGLALGLLTAFALARRREHARDAAGRRRRDVSSLSLDGKRARPSPRTDGGRGRPAQQTAPGANGSEPAQSAAAGKAADWGDRMPRTREEALEVLGIGIAPSANDAAIKKIVDGLRMSWHPDHAKDETDRALRELRSKQINAAWELLQPQRPQRQRAEV